MIVVGVKQTFWTIKMPNKSTYFVVGNFTTRYIYIDARLLDGTFVI